MLKSTPSKQSDNQRRFQQIVIFLRLEFELEMTSFDSPPTGAPKHDPTPTAHAAANISQCRDSFS